MDDERWMISRQPESPGSPTFHNGRLYVGVASAKKAPLQLPTTSVAAFAAAWSR